MKIPFDRVLIGKLCFWVENDPIYFLLAFQKFETLDLLIDFQIIFFYSTILCISGKENLASELLITKKPLEKRNLKSTTATKSTKSPNEADSKISDGKSLNVVSRIREKYNKQIDTIQEEQRNMDLSEFNLVNLTFSSSKFQT